jgi:hypothetical protein
MVESVKKLLRKPICARYTNCYIKVYQHPKQVFNKFKFIGPSNGLEYFYAQGLIYLSSKKIPSAKTTHTMLTILHNNIAKKLGMNG